VDKILRAFPVVKNGIFSLMIADDCHHPRTHRNQLKLKTRINEEQQR
jgi:hypothetical protein